MASCDYCCPSCFGDLELGREIFPSLGAKQGNCTFCKSTETLVLEPFELVNSFQPLIEIYRQDDNGEKIADLLQKDWCLFENLEQPAIDNLIDAIFEEAELSRKKFVVSTKYQGEGLKLWESFSNEIMYENRWFLDKTINLDQLESLLSSLHAINLPSQWFRARLHKLDDPFALVDMGAPPKKLSTYGRANPAGIPYLYLASKPETALAEVRPQNKESATIAEFFIGDINVVDLRDPRKRISPFILQDAEKIGGLYAELPFLEHLGYQLQKPVFPFDAAINYTPSQYLCEFIKKKNYDGVVFNSSTSDGYNLALFDEAKAKGVEVNTYSANVTVDLS